MLIVLQLPLYSAVKSTTGSLGFDANNDQRLEMELTESGLKIHTAIHYPVQHVSSDITLSSNMLIVVDGTNGDRTITLPLAAQNAGRLYDIKQTTSISKTFIKTQANDLIDGSKGLVASGGKTGLRPQLKLFSDGTQWHCIGEGGEVSSVSSLGDGLDLSSGGPFYVEGNTEHAVLTLPNAQDHDNLVMEITNTSFSENLNLSTLENLIDGAPELTLTASSAGSLSSVKLMSTSGNWSILSSTIEPELIYNKPMVMRVDTGLQPGNTFRLQFYNSETQFPLWIDWGDGGAAELKGPDSINANDRAVISHTFPSDNALYQISIRPNMPQHRIRLDMRYATLGRILTDVQSWGHFVHSSIQDAFKDCQSMDISASDALRVGGSSRANGAFTNSISLTRTPRLHLPEVTALGSAFSGCSNLLIASDIHAPKATNITSLFNGCHLMTAMANLNFASATTITNTFKDCRSVRTIHHLNLGSLESMSTLFDPLITLITIDSLQLDSVTTGAATSFEGHPTLKSVSDLHMPKVSSLFKMFTNCSQLETITGLHSGSATNYGSTFKGCSNLISVDFQDTSSGKDFSGLFMDCPKLTTVTGLDTSEAESLRPCSIAAPAWF
jgi:hypothetical protein